MNGSRRPPGNFVLAAVFIATTAAAVTFAAAVGAAELKKIAEIAIPGEKLVSFDISFIDQKTQRYYFADRSNKSVDIFDTKTNKFIGRVGGLVGAVMKADGTCCNNAKSGPNGVLAIGSEVWAGDGDSTIKVIDLKTMKIVDSIPTGGKLRANEMTYDPKDQVFIIGNQNDEPPFTTMVSTKPGHKIVGKVTFPDATDGNEQPTYNPADGLVYQSIPIMNAKTGKVVANIPGIGGADMVNYNKRNNQYYIAARALKGGPVLGVIDAGTNKLVQKIAITGGNPHSVASSEANGHVFVPVGASNGGCGCIQVYALQ